MTDTPKVVPTETKESGAPAEANMPAAVGPAAPVENSQATEPAAPKK